MKPAIKKKVVAALRNYKGKHDRHALFVADSRKNGIKICALCAIGVMGQGAGVDIVRAGFTHIVANELELTDVQTNRIVSMNYTESLETIATWVEDNC